MTIGFVILSHRSVDWYLLAKLLPRLRELGDVEIVVHHDTYQSPTDTLLLKKYGVHLLPAIERTNWSHISKVMAIIRGLKHLSQLSNQPNWYATLSPSCYPIKSSSKITAQISILRSDFYIDMRQVNFQSTGMELDKHVEEAISKKVMGYIPFISKKGDFYWRPIKVFRSKREIPFNKEFKIFHGSDWFLLNQKSVSYLLEVFTHQHPLVKFYLEGFSKKGIQTPSPVEIVIQSLLGNATELVGAYHNWHYIDWSGVRDWHPHILTERHWSDIMTSKALWARKFDLVQSAGLRTRLEAEILDVA